MSTTQWVISKYAKPEDEAEKWRVVLENEYAYAATSSIYEETQYIFWLPKHEYIPTTPPERWEEVPIEGEGRSMVLRAVAGLCARDERFIIQDGKLVLQRRTL